MKQVMWLTLLKALLFVNICFADNDSVTSAPLYVSALLRRNRLNVFPLKVRVKDGRDAFGLFNISCNKQIHRYKN